MELCVCSCCCWLPALFIIQSFSLPVALFYRLLPEELTSLSHHLSHTLNTFLSTWQQKTIVINEQQKEPDQCEADNRLRSYGNRPRPHADPFPPTLYDINILHQKSFFLYLWRWNISPLYYPPPIFFSVRQRTI